MARRRYRSRRHYSRPRFFHRRRGGMTIPLAPIIGLAAGLVRPISYVIQYPNDWVYGLDILAHNYLGINGLKQGNISFQPEAMTEGLLPLAIGVLVHKFVGGRPLNFNGMLARAKVPFIRI